MKVTRRQREVLDDLAKYAAFSSEKARPVVGADEGIAEKLAALGLVNKRYEAKSGSVYWIRTEGESATGQSVPAGFVVLLLKDLTTPSGGRENFFLARASYDGKGTTFRRLLRGWMAALDLRTKDLLGGTWGFELIEPNSRVFDGDHVILDEGVTS